MLNSVDSSLMVFELLKFCFSFVLLFFLPGWIVIRFLRITEKLNKIPVLVLSFSISLGLTSLIYTGILILQPDSSALIISIIYGILSLSPIVLRSLIGRGDDNRIFVKNRKKDYNLIEIVTLAWIASFFTYSIVSIYPGMAEAPGFDISRHYGIISATSDYPDLFRSPYPWFHLSIGALNEVTNSEMWIFQTGISFGSIILILAFYCMAKAYLYEFNRYAHLLSTIIFSCFSGLGWIFYYQNLPSLMSPGGVNSFFSIAHVATYFDIGVGHGQWLWLWFRPITIDFVLTLFLLYLMRIERLSRLTFLGLSSFIIITLSLVHFPGLLLFVLAIFILAIFVPKTRLRLKDTALSLIISLPVSVVLSISYIIIFGAYNIPFNEVHMLVLEGICIVTFLLLKYSQRVNIPISLNHKRIISIALLSYGILFVYWLTNMETIKDDIYKILAYPGVLYSVPITIFPVLLGLAGLLSIPAMVIILKNNRKNPLVIFPIIFLSILIVGRIISYIIVNFQIVDYWERRLSPYLWITVSILSPIAIIKIMDYKNNIRSYGKNFLVLKRLKTVLFIFFLVLGGTLSSYLSIELQISTTSSNKMTDNEKTVLSEITELDPHSTILTVTPRSKSIAEYQNFGFNIPYLRDQVWPSLSPELPMNILNGLNSSAIIYLNSYDIAEMTRKGYDDAYLASHVLENAPSIEKNSSISKIIQIPRLSPPTSSSEMVLILPNEVLRSQYYAYDILSLGQYNFTTALLADISTIKQAKILVAPNEEIANTIIDSKKRLDLKFENLIILNLDGYGQLGKIEGDVINPRLNHTDLIQNLYRNDDLDNNIDAYSTEYADPVDLSKYDLIKIDWPGQGKNDIHTIQFSSDSNGIIKYEFNDSWKGLKQILLPMNLTDIDSGFNEIDVQREVINNASWSDISKISIITPDSFASPEPSINLNDFLYISYSEADSIQSNYINDTISFSEASIIHSNYPSSYKVNSVFENNIPFILQKEGENYDIHYINIFPLLENLHNNNLFPTEIYSLYDTLLEGLEIDFPVYNTTDKTPLSLVTGGIGAFSNGTFIGNVTTLSTSAIINTKTVESIINIDGADSNIENMLQVVPWHVDQVKTNSNSSRISGMYGFYANSISPHQTALNFIGNPAILSVIYNNNEERVIYGSNITIQLDNANIIYRQPKVMVDGVSNFSQFYAYGELGDKIHALGTDLEVKGKSNFDITYADKFIMIDNAQLNSNYETEYTGYFRDNENINLLKVDNLFKVDTLSYITLLILIFCLYNVLITKRKKIKDVQEF